MTETPAHRFFELSNDLLCIADFDGVARQMNPAWERLLGYRLEEMVGRPFLDFVHPEDRRAAVAETLRARSEGGSVSFECRVLRKDGGIRWLLWTSRGVEEERLFYAAARDITELKDVQAQLSAAKEKAEAASRAKSAFLAHMSHELKTPLNAVLGFAKVLRKDPQGKLGENERLFLSRIVENGHHLLDIIQDLLDLSRIEAGRLSVEWAPCDLAALCSSVVAQFQIEPREEVALVVDCPSDLEPIVTDAGRLRQVLTNLVGNALKFTPRGTVTLSVRADARTRAPREIAVSDTGIGIPAARQAAVFEPFEQADRSTTRRFGGTGLGLTIARSLCELLGYRLRLESEEGRGTTFRLDLRHGGVPEEAF